MTAFKNYSCFAASLSAFVVVIALQCGHSNWGEMKSKGGISLNFFYIQGS
jgi:hypothetical protein